MKIQRYSFEDALIKWGADKGKKEATAVSVGLRLCSQLNWNKGGVLRWRVDLACKEAGIKKSTYHNAMKILKEAGFFFLDGDLNLRVSLPETAKSLPETTKSPTETSKSPQQHPFSEVYLFSEEQVIKEMDCRRATFPLDSLEPFTLISKPARSEHFVMPHYTGQEWMERAQARQAEINKEMMEEFDVA